MSRRIISLWTRWLWFTYLVAPFLDNLYNKIKPSIKYLAAIILLSFFIIDNIYCHNNPNMGEGLPLIKMIVISS